MIVWSLEEGVHLVREMQPVAREHGYHICLGGGVLNAGSSEKDLDLYFLPLIGEAQKPLDMLKRLEDSYLGPYDGTAFSGGNNEGPYTEKLRYSPQGKRLEIFLI